MRPMAIMPPFDGAETKHCTIGMNLKSTMETTQSMNGFLKTLGATTKIMDKAPKEFGLDEHIARGKQIWALFSAWGTISRM